jgi:peptidoglycan/LPS O-acetylase OafA/YrhL
MFYYFTTWKLYIVYSSNLGLDEFFFLSSFLATLKIHAFIQTKGGRLTFVDYLKLLLHRYLRLAPIYYLVFVFGWQIGPFLGNGPCWFTYENGFSNCS